MPADPILTPPPTTENRSAGLGPNAAKLLEQAGSAINRRELDEAERTLTGLIALAPGHPETLRLRAVILHLRGKYAEAVELLRRAIEAKPDDALIWNNLGSALGEQGDMDAALNAFRRSRDLAPTTAAAWYNLGKALDHQAYTVEAEQVLRRALELDPTHQPAQIAHASAYRTLGRTAEAVAEYRAVLAQDPDCLGALMGLAGMKTVPLTREELAALTRLNTRRDLSESDRSNASFALMQALEAQGRHTEAFAIAANANAVKRRTLQWDAASFTRRVSAIGAAAATPLKTTSPPNLGEEVIFIVSMPRSGSTLTEQVIAAHPEVEGANELEVMPSVIEGEARTHGLEYPYWFARMQPSDWERLGRTYLEKTARWRAKKPRFTDKALSNWQYVQAMRAMLPGATIINCRRDPLETCLSCFLQAFAQGQAYTYDMHELVSFYRDYDRLARLWLQKYPDYFHELIYEDLLADPEKEIRRLLEICRLPFDERCLRFHEAERSVRTASAAQVREPLRKNTARAARYGALLAPMRRGLGMA